MIVYHGTPFGGTREGVAAFLRGRHALVPYPRPEDLGAALEVCQTVIVDNGAFSAWKSGRPIVDWSSYYAWLETFYRHPAFAWAIIPDVIDGDESDNDELVDQWPCHIPGVPVWHLHESLDRLQRLIRLCSRIAFGSSGQWSSPGTPAWHYRMAQAMEVLCDSSGMPLKPLHGLRMADTNLVKKYPFASVDSTNSAQNSCLIRRFGTYPSATRWQRADSIARGMEGVQSPGYFEFSGQHEIDFELTNQEPNNASN